MEVQRIILVFVDGLGVGSSDPANNPIVRRRYPAIERIAGNVPLCSAAPQISRVDHVYRGIDASLGIGGLPQSGTGQATLFTGVNCAEVAGRHYGPFPHSSSRPIIRDVNLFKTVASATGTSPLFANAYPDRFFRYMERTNRWTVTTLCCAAAGIPLRTGADLREGRAISADITGSSWPEPESDHQVITPQEAGHRLVGLSKDAPLTVFEYFATDKAGHEKDFEQADAALVRLDGLIEGILDTLESRQTLVMTSDHGNVEDLSVKTHTLNPVPLAAWGVAAHHFRGIESLTSVKSAVLAALDGSD